MRTLDKKHFILRFMRSSGTRDLTSDLRGGSDAVDDHPAH
jgi:hypothetical protein